MQLSDLDLANYLAKEMLVVDPLGSDAIQPNSIDLRLGDSFQVMESHAYACILPDVHQPGLFRPVRAVGMPFMLHPGEFVLGTTLETVRLCPSITAQLTGRSSLGRLGLVVHSTAGLIDAGFEGPITLELSNVARLPIKLTPGMGIGQISVSLLTSTAVRPYGHAERNSKYQGQIGATTSRFHENYPAKD